MSILANLPVIEREEAVARLEEAIKRVWTESGSSISEAKLLEIVSEQAHCTYQDAAYALARLGAALSA